MSGNTTMIAAHIARLLNEPNLDLIAQIITRCGASFVQEVLAETQRRETEGGILVQDGSRRRTPGGAFFFLVKERLRKAGRKDDLDALFASPPPASRPRSMPSAAGPALVPRLRRRKRSSTVAESGTLARRLPGDHPDQTYIRTVLDCHLGHPPDLYRCSINPDNGDVTLRFNFPTLAWERYGEAIADAAAEARVSITIHPQPNQEALRAVVLTILPPGIALVGEPSLLVDQQHVRVKLSQNVSDEQCASLQAAFFDETGWNLDITCDTTPAIELGHLPLDQHRAVATVRSYLGDACYRVSANSDERILTVRFSFPDVAREHFADTLAQLEEGTGWHIVVHPQAHQGLLISTAREMLPLTLTPVSEPSLHQSRRVVVIRCRGTVATDALAFAQAEFLNRTGWTLDIVSNGGEPFS